MMNKELEKRLKELESRAYPENNEAERIRQKFLAMFNRPQTQEELDAEAARRVMMDQLIGHRKEYFESRDITPERKTELTLMMNDLESKLGLRLADRT